MTMSGNAQRQPISWPNRSDVRAASNLPAVFFQVRDLGLAHPTDELVRGQYDRQYVLALMRTAVNTSARVTSTLPATMVIFSDVPAELT